VVRPQIREDWEETKRWAEEKERGKRVEKSEVGQEFEDEKETKGGRRARKRGNCKPTFVSGLEGISLVVLQP
jgi:hypothetical protein